MGLFKKMATFFGRQKKTDGKEQAALKNLTAFSSLPIGSDLSCLKDGSAQWNCHYIIAQRQGDYAGLRTAFKLTQICGQIQQDADGTLRQHWDTGRFVTIMPATELGKALTIINEFEKEHLEQQGFFPGTIDTGYPVSGQVRQIFNQAKKERRDNSGLRLIKNDNTSTLSRSQDQTLCDDLPPPAPQGPSPSPISKSPRKPHPNLRLVG